MPLFRATNLFPTGYVRRRSAVKDFIRTTHKPFLAGQNGDIRRSSEGKAVRLVKALEAVTTVPYENAVQEIGDCVGQGFTLGGDVVCATDIVTLGEREEWRGKHSTEVTYALSRVEIGGGRIRGDGSTGAWAAKAVTHYGLLLRGRYRDYDLRVYDPRLAKRWGDLGVPDELEPLVREHPIKTAALVTSAEEAADSIANGYPVAVCSGQGFSSTTDSEGFLKARGSWAHCMLIWGFDRRPGKRPGFEIANSWPASWVRGPKHELGTAASAFWADWSVVDRMLRQGDSYALSGFQGYPARRVDYILL